MAWKASHYAHLIPLSDGNGVVYNGRSGALVKLSPGAFARCGTIMKSGAPGKPQDEIIKFVTDRFATQKFPSMAVDWFGGEPLLALGAIEYLSDASLAQM